MEFRKLKSLGPKIVRILHLQVSQELSQLSKFLHFTCTRTNSYRRLCCVIVWAAISSEALPVYQPGTPGASQRIAMWWRSGEGAVLQIFDHLNNSTFVPWCSSQKSVKISPWISLAKVTGLGSLGCSVNCKKCARSKCAIGKYERWSQYWL